MRACCTLLAVTIGAGAGISACAAAPERRAATTVDVAPATSAQSRSAVLGSPAPHVGLDNQRPIDERTSPVFAAYLDLLAARIQPVLAEALARLDALPASDPRNKQGRSTRVELVIDDSGALRELSVVLSSTAPDFDERVMQAVRGAAPFPAPPLPIRSYDGRTYVQWDLSREPDVAASPRFAHPFLLIGEARTPVPAPRARTVPSRPLGSPRASDAPVLSMKDGTPAPLSPVATLFATYLNAMHNRIHPEFADKEMKELDALPRGAPANDTRLVTRVELVLDGATGTVVERAVSRTSGVPDFDARAMAALERAAPFGEAPPGIRSADGRVYVRWEMYRDEVYACSTMHARPFLFTRTTP